MLARGKKTSPMNDLIPQISVQGVPGGIFGEEGTPPSIQALSHLTGVPLFWFFMISPFD